MYEANVGSKKSEKAVLHESVNLVHLILFSSQRPGIENVLQLLKFFLSGNKMINHEGSLFCVKIKQLKKKHS